MQDAPTVCIVSGLGSRVEPVFQFPGGGVPLEALRCRADCRFGRGLVSDGHGVRQIPHGGKKVSTYGGVTAGLGGRTALHYRYDQYRSNQDDIQTNQLNLMYQVIPGLSVYGGYVHAKTDVADWDKSSDSAQVGLQGRFDIPLLFTVWGTAGYGDKLNSFEIGVSKPLLNNLDVDVSYYSNRFKKLDQGGDAESRGVRAGLTIKF